MIILIHGPIHTKYIPVSIQLCVYRIMHKTYKIPIGKRQGQPQEFWSLVSVVVISTLPQYCVEEKLNACKVPGKITINMTVNVWLETLVSQNLLLQLCYALSNKNIKKNSIKNLTHASLHGNYMFKKWKLKSQIPTLLIYIFPLSRYDPISIYTIWELWYSALIWSIYCLYMLDTSCDMSNTYSISYSRGHPNSL